MMVLLHSQILAPAVRRLLQQRKASAPRTPQIMAEIMVVVAEAAAVEAAVAVEKEKEASHLCKSYQLILCLNKITPLSRHYFNVRRAVRTM
jgi:hypothetical protein